MSIPCSAGGLTNILCSLSTSETLKHELAYGISLGISAASKHPLRAGNLEGLCCLRKSPVGEKEEGEGEVKLPGLIWKKER